MRTDKELDFLEKQIPVLAESAVRKAYLDALSRGSSVLEVKAGYIVETFPDGSHKLIKETDADIKVDEKYLAVK